MSSRVLNNLSCNQAAILELKMGRELGQVKHKSKEEGTSLEEDEMAWGGEKYIAHCTSMSCQSNIYKHTRNF